MECKHEKGLDIDIEVMGAAYTLQYVCDECCEEWPENQVTIIPNKDAQLMQDVIEAGEAVKDNDFPAQGEYERDEDGDLIGWDEDRIRLLGVLYKALKALKEVKE